MTDIIDDLQPFESPRYLIEGAKRSIVELEELCASFLRACSYDIVQHVDPSTRETVVRAKFHHRIPGHIRVVASRIANDLRHALDQAVCDAAVLLGRKNTAGVYFPIGRSTSDFEQAILARCKNVHPRIIEFIRQYRPYQGGNDAFYEMAALVGPNKHQRIMKISMGDNGGMLRGEGTNIFLTSARTGINRWNELRNELELSRYGAGSFGYLNHTPRLLIVVGSGHPPLDGPAPTVLRRFAETCQGFVDGLALELLP